jgi:uncharacterized protein YndB with AHSA1/START domain
MADIRHRVGIAAPQSRVYEELTTTEGLSRWWTRDLDGDPKQGGTPRFFFGAAEPAAVMDVIDTTEPSHVGWRCAEGPEEWVGTDLRFDLSRSGDETVVVFTHGDWRQPVEFMHHCSTKWAYFLLGMKAGLEGGEATAFPRDMKISSWG